MSPETKRPQAEIPDHTWNEWSNALVTERREQFVNDLEEAVSLASINPARTERRDDQVGEARFQHFFQELCRVKGLPATLRESHLEARPNVEVALPGDLSRRSLLLNGHCDVVAADEPNWNHPPFEARVADGYVRGRGAADAKGSLLAMLQAVWIARELAGDALGPITLTSVVDEEAGGGGTEAWLRDQERFGKPLPDAAIVGEPTGLQPSTATRGARSFQLAVRGLGAHAGEAYRGVNAINLAMRFVEALEALHRDLACRADAQLWSELDTPYVFNFGRIGGGSSFASVAADCEIEGVVGWVPPDTLASMSARVERVVAEVTQADPWLQKHPPEWRWSWLAFEASQTPTGHPLAHLLEEESRRYGYRGEPRGLLAGTDMRLLRSFDIPTVNFGPGDMSQGHAANEQLEISQYLDAIRILANVILRWCLAKKGGAA